MKGSHDLSLIRRQLCPDRKKILIVDDELDILQVLKVILEEEGYEVEATDKGEQVERLPMDDLPDLILLDVLLSGKDGREIVKCLRARQETRSIPIVMISAHPDARETALACGANAFLAKPFEIDDLLDKVAQYCQL